jgi:hypothetical protein
MAFAGRVVEARTAASLATLEVAGATAHLRHVPLYPCLMHVVCAEIRFNTMA